MTNNSNSPILSLVEIKDFNWILQNIIHIAAHEVEPGEVEEVAFDDDPWIKRGRGGVRYMFGQTLAGRYLFTVYVLDRKSAAEVVSAREMTQQERRYYQKRGK